MKIITEYQYFGNVNIYKILYKNKNIIFEQCENFQKSSLRNKMELPSPNGLLQLSIPNLGGRGFGGNIKETVMDDEQNWKAKHIKTITSIYNNSPWFEYYKNELYTLYKDDEKLLYKWNMKCFEWVCAKLKLNAIVTETEIFKLNYNNDEYIDLRILNEKKQNINKNDNADYSQVFEDKIGFKPNMCILDLLFCEGPNAGNLLMR